MHFPRVALGVLFTAGALALACSDDDTIIAVNVGATDDVGRVSLVRVTISKDGESPITFEMSPTREEVNTAAGQGGETRMGDQTDRRVNVTGWDRGTATVRVDLIGPDGGVLLSEEDKITVRPNEATASFVDFTRAMPMGGMGGMGGGGTGGTGGTDAAGGTTGGTDAAGGTTGGTDAAGGTTGGTDATGGVSAGTGGTAGTEADG